jgi:hypothetical protein
MAILSSNTGVTTPSSNNPGSWLLFDWQESIYNWLNPTVSSAVNPPSVPANWASVVGPGENADALVTGLVNEQMKGQQRLNAGNVVSTVPSMLLGGAYATGEAISSVPWGLIAVGVGVIGILALRR